MGYEAINFGKKFKLFDEQWQPKVIAEMNDYQFKVVKLCGDFIWHDHKDTDETFIVQARRWVVAVKSAKYGQRITLTYPVLEASAGRQCHRLHLIRLERQREMVGTAQANRTRGDASGGPSGWQRRSVRNRPRVACAEPPA
jgi:hypothetical protein